MITTELADDHAAGIKGFRSAFTLVERGAAGANEFLTHVVEDQELVILVDVADLGDKAGNTEYMLKGAKEWRTIGADLTGTYGALDGPPSRVGALIELNNRPNVFRLGYLEVACVLAHEVALHAMSIETRRAKILARDAGLQTEWPGLVASGGQFSEQYQHTGAAYDLNANYSPLIENMCKHLSDNGATDDASKLMTYYRNDILGLKVETAKREKGSDYLKHHLLEGVRF